jgi:4-hydroxy-3-methylbut-2-enyl diphosphate reductase
MKVLVAKSCGFCPGVKNAIRTAEEILAVERRVFCLGAIIHNPDVVKRLAGAGLVTVDGVDEIDGGTVLIRSHGASAGEIARLEKKAVRIVDATCVLVKRLKRIAAELDGEGYRVIVIGDREHPEVRAVVGDRGNISVVAEESDLRALPPKGRLGIVCQTTESPEKFHKMLGAIAKRGFEQLKVINTLCSESIRRQRSAVNLCRRVDVMFVLGGLRSANTRKLAQLCGKYNPRTFHLQNWTDFDKRMVSAASTAGVTAGASTPQWVIDEFVRKLEGLEGAASGRRKGPGRGPAGRE